MAYDMKYNRDCDLHYFTSYVAMITSSITMIVMVFKFGKEIKDKVNCFHDDKEVPTDESTPLAQN